MLHVLVVGDLYLDEYIVGKPSRISREAPIAVLEFKEQKCVPGGATAPACNIMLNVPCIQNTPMVGIGIPTN